MDHRCVVHLAFWRTALFIASILVAPIASAQPRLSDQCSNAATALALSFPLGLPPDVVTGEATVGFTIGSDGAVVNATAIEASRPAFGDAAVAAVKKLSCSPRNAPERFSLPMAFSKPGDIPAGRCDLEQLWKGSDFAFRSSGSRLRGVESAVVEFILQPSGQVTELVVLRTSSEAYGSEVSRVYQKLKCSESGERLKIRTTPALILKR